MDRFRLLDSLLRSLLPPATLGAILLGFSLVGVVALPLLLDDLLHTLHFSAADHPVKWQRRLLKTAGVLLIFCCLVLIGLETLVSLFGSRMRTARGSSGITSTP